MNNKKILEKYNKVKNKVKQMELANDSHVVGTEVDEDNKLWYVIQKGSELTLERANRKKIKHLPPVSGKKSITVKGKKIVED